MAISAGIDQNLQPFTGNDDVSEWVKNSRVGRKTNQLCLILMRYAYIYYMYLSELNLHRTIVFLKI